VVRVRVQLYSVLMRYRWRNWYATKMTVSSPKPRKRMFASVSAISVHPP
jgi:hypothetical protein